MADLLTIWRLYCSFESTKMTRKINGLFYYIRKLPFLGKRISITLYRNYEIKKILFIMGTLLSILIKIMLKCLWLLVFFGVFSAITSLLDLAETVINVKAILVLWLLMAVLLRGIYSSLKPHFNQEEGEFVRNFGVSKRLFLRSRMIVETLYNGLAYLPGLIVLGVVTHQPVLIPIISLLSYIGSQLLFFYLSRLLSFRSKGLYYLIGYGSCILIILVTGLLIWCEGLLEVFKWTYSIWGLVAMLGLVVISSRLLLCFKEENRYVTWLMDQSNQKLTLKQQAKEGANTYLGEGLKMQKELTLIEGEQAHLQGNQYLNSLLFSRYRSTLRKQLYLRLLGIVVIGLLIGIGLRIASGGDLAKVTLLDEKTLISALPVLFFVMYLLTFGRKVVQMVFINCDSSMLFYPFYREPKTILQGFFYRFKMTFYYNGILSLTIFLMVILVNTFNNFFISLNFFSILGLLLLSLSFLFSFHELFVYYMLQPFTSDMEVINPLYKIISGIFYGIAYVNLQLKSTGLTYVLLVSVLSLLYVGIGLLIIRWKAPVTFKYKG